MDHKDQRILDSINRKRSRSKRVVIADYVAAALIVAAGFYILLRVKGLG